jgi:putative DNA primase/helicase
VVSPQEMIEAGWSLVPVPHGKKGPVHDGWNNRPSCIADIKKLSRLNGGNLGIAHAYCTPSPTCAIDIDHYKNAGLWLGSIGVDIKSLLIAKDAVVIWSGKRYSLKLLYRLPEGTPALESKKINGIDGKTALEFRCGTKDGKTVQDVLPPSVHPSGNQYRWLGGNSPLMLPVIPESLLQIWRELILNGARVSERRSAEGGGQLHRLESPREIATINEALGHISADCSYDKWRSIVWAILSTGWDCAESIAQTWSESARHRYDEDAFWLLVNSYIPDLQNQITVGTIYFHARQGGWHG